MEQGTDLDGNQVLKESFNETDNALRTYNLGTLVPESFDFVGATYPDTVTEVFTYRTGGASGTVVAIVTLVYVDATKDLILSVTRS